MYDYVPWDDLKNGKQVPPIEVAEPPIKNEGIKIAPIAAYNIDRDLQEIASELHKLNNNIGMLIKSIRTRK